MMVEGVARVVSVISAKAEMEGRKVALAVPLEVPLAILRAELAQATRRIRRRGCASSRAAGGPAPSSSRP